MKYLVCNIATIRGKYIPDALFKKDPTTIYYNPVRDSSFRFPGNLQTFVLM